jgi:hypothetical protein
MNASKQPQGLVLELCKDLAKMIDEATANMTSEQTDAYVNRLAHGIFMANSIQFEKK